MGEVWVAHHRTLREHVALKLLTSALEGDVVEDGATAAARFRFEAQIAARLSRKTRHIVRVTDHGEEDGLAYLVMELLEGKTLDAMLEQGSGRLPVEVVADVVSQIARALTHAHTEGVFHRDLKPANVFVSQDEEGRRLVKVLDFGIARAIHAHRVRGPFATAKGLVFGTPGYMSPEQARASDKLDHRCDLWALAVIAYESLSGKLPIEGVDTEEILKNLCAGRLVPLRERLPNAPSGLSAFFDRAFGDRIESRCSSASELAGEFAKAAGVPALRGALPSSPTLPVEADPRGPQGNAQAATNSPRPSGRDRVRAVSLAAVGAALGLTALGVAWRLSHPPAAAATAPADVRAATSGTGAPPIAQPVIPRSTVDEQPALDVSSLPRAAPHPLSAARGPAFPAAPPQPPTSAPTATAGAPALPPAAPRPQPKPHDKSEVL